MVTILHKSLLPSGVKLTPDLMLNLVNEAQNKELLGQILDPKQKFSGKLDANRVSHIVKNIRYNPLIEAVEVDIEPLPTPFGEQLQLIMKSYPDKIIFKPIIKSDIIDSDIKLTLIGLNLQLRV